MDAPKLPPWVIALSQDAKFVEWGEMIDRTRKDRGDLDENGRVVSMMAKEEAASRKAFNETLARVLGKLKDRAAEVIR